MSVLSGVRTVYPRGYIFGQVRADRQEKGFISVTEAPEYFHRVPPRQKSAAAISRPLE